VSSDEESVISLIGVLSLGLSAMLRRFSYARLEFSFNLTQYGLLCCAFWTFVQVLATSLYASWLQLFAFVGFGLLMVVSSYLPTSTSNISAVQERCRLIVGMQSIFLSCWGIFSPRSFLTYRNVDCNDHIQTLLALFFAVNLAVNAFFLISNGLAIRDSCLISALAWTVAVAMRPTVLNFPTPIVVINASAWIASALFAAFVFRLFDVSYLETRQSSS